MNMHGSNGLLLQVTNTPGAHAKGAGQHHLRYSDAEYSEGVRSAKSTRRGGRLAVVQVTEDYICDQFVNGQPFFLGHTLQLPQ